MQNIFRIIKIARPLYHLVIALIILIVINAALALTVPILSKSIVDEIVKNVQGSGGNLQNLIFLIGLTFVLSVISLILTVISERLGDHFAGRLRKFLTEKFYSKILSLPQTYYDSEVSGKIINQLSRGISSIQEFLNTSSNFIFPTVLQSVFTIAILAYYSIPIALFTFLLFPIYLSLSYYSTKRWGVHEVEKNKIEDTLRGRILEVIGNITLVKSFNNQKPEYELVSSKLEKSNKIYAKQSHEFHVFDFYRGLSLNIILTFINIVVFYNTFQGTLSIGEMVLILQLVNQARFPLFAMSFILGGIQMAEAGSKEFFEVLELPTNEDYTKPIKTPLVKNPTIRFENITFQYEKSENVLNSVSFTFNKNETVALVGHSGAGKSTIVNLLLKFYEPANGEIYLNDDKYSELTHSEIRQNVALVFQDNELFSSTIRENVGYGSTAAEKKIINALKLANAYEFVKKLPKGLDSEIGERGVRLSGGQKQRIQIARAILKDAPILILDEATSSLDAKSEREVQDALNNLMKNRLVIIIAHRFSTIQNADKIIVINEGKIVDSGTPKELAGRKGIYQDLLNYQVEGNKKLLASFDLY